jgi:hypothetical protein
MSKFGPALNVLRLFDQILLDDFILASLLWLMRLLCRQAWEETRRTLHCHLYFKASLQLSLF